MFNENYGKKIIHIYILVWILIFILIIMGFSMVRYFAIGEKNIPFKISKILVVSTAKTTNVQLNENEYLADIIQNNDIYLSIEKNEKYKKDDSIKEIIIDNYEIVEGTSMDNLEIYKDELLTESIILNGVATFSEGGSSTEILNQGGLIKFSIVFNKLGNITYSEDKNLKIDGNLLEKIGITFEEIKCKVSFDLKIKLESGKSFYTNVVLELPVANIIEDGISSDELETDNLIYKRGI